MGEEVLRKDRREDDNEALPVLERNGGRGPTFSTHTTPHGSGRARGVHPRGTDGRGVPTCVGPSLSGACGRGRPRRPSTTSTTPRRPRRRTPGGAGRGLGVGANGRGAGPSPCTEGGPPCRRPVYHPSADPPDGRPCPVPSGSERRAEAPLAKGGDPGRTRDVGVRQEEPEPPQRTTRRQTRRKRDTHSGRDKREGERH